MVERQKKQRGNERKGKKNKETLSGQNKGERRCKRRGKGTEDKRG